MNSYTFQGGWIRGANSVFVSPVTWKEGDAEVEVQVDPRRDTDTSNNYEFISLAVFMEGNLERKLVLVPDNGAPVRANVLEVRSDDPVRIRVEPIPDTKQ